MKLTEMIEQGYDLRAWAMKTIRGERRVVVVSIHAPAWGATENICEVIRGG